jgi:hypothetical protein
MYWSYAAPAWCGLIAMLSDGRAIVRHEFSWRQTVETKAAAELSAFLKAKKITLTALVAQPHIFPQPKQIGPSVSEGWRGPWSLYRGHDDLTAGWHRLHAWLNDDDDLPQLVIHESCTRLIKTLPTLVASKTHPDALDIGPEMYPVWGLANWAMSRPTPGWKPEPEIPEGCLHRELEDIRRENARAMR